MKHEKLLTALIAWLLSFCIAMGGVGCMVSGLRLEPENMLSVALWCGICTAVCCVCLSLRRGGLVLLCLAAFLGSYFYREGTMMLQLESLLNKISQVYDMGYDCGTVSWSGKYLGDVSIDMGLSLIACLCAAAATYPLCRRKSAFFSVLLCALPLFSCMVVTDSVPAEGWLFLLLASLMLLIVTNTLRRRSRADGIRITALLLVPVLLTMTLLFTAIPQDGYDTQMNGVQQSIFSWFRSLPFIVETPDGQLIFSFDGTAEDEMNLKGVGPKTQLHYAVMDVLAEKSGFLYLRGQSFDTYDGTSWKASKDALSQSVGWPDTSKMVPGGMVTVFVRAARSFRYMPYYPSGGNWRYRFSQGKLINTSMEKEYSFVRMLMSEDSYVSVDLDRLEKTQFLQLPGGTLNNAQQILIKIKITEFGSTEKVAEAIGKWVESSATYSLNTPRMPGDESDFAMWFLNNSDTGYCVHFATAATVLLRAAGIPARYVTGYTCEAAAGKRVTVTADKAHAWVEYYDAGKGSWMVLDPTPGGESSTGGNTGNPDVEITRPTRPVVTPTTPTVESTEATEPVDNTWPQETTEATEPVESTQPSGEETEPSSGIGIGVGDGTASGGIGQLWETLKPALTGLLWIMSVVGVLWGQYLLRRRYRRKQMHTGPNNQRALARWREVLRMARILRTVAPDSLETLAEKAKFSQHTLTVGELMEFDAWMKQERVNFNNRHWLYRLLCRLIWAVE